MRRKDMLLTDAIAFAAKCHEGQLRKGTDIPYIVHPMEACAIAATLTTDPEVLAAAVLHDVVEDAGVSESELRERFGDRVASLVAAESEQKEADAAGSWQRRKRHAVDRLRGASRDERILTLADKLSNLRAIDRDFGVLGDALWRRFNQPDKGMHAWYYRSIRDALAPLRDTAAFQEYSKLVDGVFGPAE
jgi:myo-inositol-1(or 4)-monophosphatase